MQRNVFSSKFYPQNSETIGDLEYEINEDKFIGRGNLGIPVMVKNSIPLSKKLD